jgi:hypothetical protein
MRWKGNRPDLPTLATDHHDALAEEVADIAILLGPLLGREIRNCRAAKVGEERCQVPYREGERCGDEVRSVLVEHGQRPNARRTLGTAERWLGGITNQSGQVLRSSSDASERIRSL